MTQQLFDYPTLRLSGFRFASGFPCHSAITIPKYYSSLHKRLDHQNWLQRSLKHPIQLYILKEYYDVSSPPHL